MCCLSGPCRPSRRHQSRGCGPHILPRALFRSKTEARGRLFLGRPRRTRRLTHRRHPGPGSPRGCCQTIHHPHNSSGCFSSIRFAEKRAFCVLSFDPPNFQINSSYKVHHWIYHGFSWKFSVSPIPAPNITHTQRCVVAKCTFALSQRVITWAALSL